VGCERGRQTGVVAGEPKKKNWAMGLEERAGGGGGGGGGRGGGGGGGGGGGVVRVGVGGGGQPLPKNRRT